MSETHIMHFCHDCAERARILFRSIDEQHRREAAAITAERDAAVAVLKEAFPWLEMLEETDWSRELHDLIGRATEFLVRYEAREII